MYRLTVLGQSLHQVESQAISLPSQPLGEGVGKVDLAMRKPGVYFSHSESPEQSKFFTCIEDGSFGR